MSASLAERDVDGVLSVLGLAASMDGSEPFELSVIERLVELIPADDAGYWEYGDDGDAFFVSVCPCDPQAWEYWREAKVNGFLDDWWPLHDDRLRPLGTATFFSDVVTQREKRRHPWYAESCGRAAWSTSARCFSRLRPASRAASTSAATAATAISTDAIVRC
jgi:hypothetical protein